MRSQIIAVCLIASVCASQFKLPVEVTKIEIGKAPKREIPLNAFSKEILKGLVHQVQALKPHEGTVAILNQYGDELFSDIQKYMVESGMNPLDIPDIHSEFTYTIIWEETGTFDMTKGKLFDLPTIHRSADLVIAYSPELRMLDVTVPIGFDDLHIDFNYAVEIIGLKPTGTVDGIVKDLSIEIKLGFNTVTYEFTLEDFYILHAGDISVTFGGDVLIDWLLDAIAFVAETALKEVVLLVVEDLVRGQLGPLLDQINSSIDQLINPPSTPAPAATAAPFFGKRV